jgi:hypothetical protein
MNHSLSNQSGNRSYELRFVNLFDAGRAYAFPCDAKGCVDIDALGDVVRTNYLYARTVIGREFAAPVTCAVADSQARALGENA